MSGRAEKPLASAVAAILLLMASSQSNAALMASVCGVNSIANACAPGENLATGGILTIRGYALDMDTGDRPTPGGHVVVRNEDTGISYKIPIQRTEVRPDVVANAAFTVASAPLPPPVKVAAVAVGVGAVVVSELTNNPPSNTPASPQAGGAAAPGSLPDMGVGSGINSVSAGRGNASPNGSTPDQNNPRTSNNQKPSGKGPVIQGRR